MTSQVENIDEKCTFTHKLTTSRNFQTASLFSSTVTDWKAQDSAITSATFKNRSDEGISGDRNYKHCIRTFLDAFWPWNVSCEGSVFQCLDAAKVLRGILETFRQGLRQVLELNSAGQHLRC